MEPRAQRKFVISRDGKPNLMFTGVQLGKGADDYTKVRLFKATSGKFVLEIEEKDPYAVSVVFRGSAPDKHRALTASNVAEFIAVVGKDIGVYNEAVKQAFLEASDVEPALKQYAVEEI